MKPRNTSSVDIEGYRELAVSTVTSLLEVEHAVVWTEVEARLSDRRWGPSAIKIDPHHLTTARRRMLEDQLLVPTSEKTRGGRYVETYSLAGAPKRASEAAAARKRLLHGRFLGWAKGTARHPRGLIGGAGESVASASLQAAAHAGYRLVDHSGGHVAELLGEPVPGGALDEAAHLILMDGDLPNGVVTIPIEVKNIREWLYPSSAELYQLLTKAHLLQVAHPGRSIVPVMVCRRAHKTTFVMAKAMGFYVIDTKRHYITPSADVTDEALVEVRLGLGFADLTAMAGEDKLVTKHFAQHLPAVAEDFAARWKLASPLLGHLFPVLRNPSLHPIERAAHMDDLRALARELPGGTSGW